MVLDVTFTRSYTSFTGFNTCVLKDFICVSVLIGGKSFNIIGVLDQIPRYFIFKKKQSGNYQQ